MGHLIISFLNSVVREVPDHSGRAIRCVTPTDVPFCGQENKEHGIRVPSLLGSGGTHF